MVEDKITDPRPDYVEQDLVGLRSALDDVIPARVPDRNLLIATWNIWNFGDLTKKWVAKKGDSPQRDFQCVHCIAEVISRFDVVALQEVTGNLRALRHMLKLLGSHWGLLMTDVNKGRRGDNERLAFVFDTRKIQLSGLACEIVVPPDYRGVQINQEFFDKQFARTPYAVGFRSISASKSYKPRTFIITNLHVCWSGTTDQALDEREEELKAIATWLADWANDLKSWGHNLLTMGDFNIDQMGKRLHKSFTSTGLFIHEDFTVANAPRTYSKKPTFYDQIAWFVKDGTPQLSLEFKAGGSFDFIGHVLSNRNLSKAQMRYRISDHFPLWAEFLL